MRSLWAFIFLFSVSWSLSATEHSPWLGDRLVPIIKGAIWLNNYSAVASDHGTKHRNANDVFFQLLGSIAPKEFFEVELEGIAAKTHHHRFEMDSLLLTGRYRLTNDIVGDPLTVTPGLTVSRVFKYALHDIAAFHHGGIQAEAFLSAGREFICREFWTSRAWGVFGVGIADHGSPWILGDISWEHNWWDRHELKLFVHTLWGLGNNALNLHKPFRGYGPIRHHSIDLGLRYSLGLGYNIFVRAEYAYRVYARNCPENVNHFLVSVFYPFNL